MRKSPLAVAAVLAASVAIASQAGFAQSAPPRTGPTPAQAGADPSMAPPAPSTEPLKAPPTADNPESTVGLAPADQPVNNANRNVAGEVMPSSQMTAAHEPSILEHDRLPTFSHTFNFTADQKQQIKSALAQDAGVAVGPDVQIEESVVLPRSVEVKPVPESVTQSMPWVKRYNYVKAGNKIVLVDPSLRAVAAVIE